VSCLIHQEKPAALYCALKRYKAINETANALKRNKAITANALKRNKAIIKRYGMGCTIKRNKAL
jgi:hypothetical protein